MGGSYDKEVITKVSDALIVLNSLEDFFGKDEWPFHEFPFGLWFRGHSKKGCELEPRAFREQLPEDANSKGLWDETNVYEVLKLRVPSHEHTYHTAFDWLCLMQHYSLPTRLLDWSESILPALFFAVKDDPALDGELIALNAKRLNRRSKIRPTISTPDDYSVVIRAEMAATRSKLTLKGKRSVVTALREAPRMGPFGWDWLQWFRCPVAVFPRRLNERMVFQSSVFTLHGGKKYSGEMLRWYAKNERMPGPITLATIDAEARRKGKGILERYVIPSCHKAEILRDLFRLGIHEAALFPEVDRQADYLRQLWWYRTP